MARAMLAREGESEQVGRVETGRDDDLRCKRAKVLPHVRVDMNEAALPRKQAFAKKVVRHAQSVKVPLPVGLAAAAEEELQLDAWRGGKQLVHRQPVRRGDVGDERNAHRATAEFGHGS